MYYHSNQQALKKLKILLEIFRFSQILRRGGNSANVMQSQRYGTAGAKHTLYRPFSIGGPLQKSIMND